MCFPLGKMVSWLLLFVGEGYVLPAWEKGGLHGFSPLGERVNYLSYIIVILFQFILLCLLHTLWLSVFEFIFVTFFFLSWICYPFFFRYLVIS